MHWQHTAITVILNALVALTLLPSPTGAALYPTKPIQETVLTAGEDVIVKWKDDESSPHLEQVGPLTIELMINDDELISTLATDINPLDRAASVRIEQSFGVDGSNYYLRFVPQDGQNIVYTSTFRINGLTGSPSYRESPLVVGSSLNTKNKSKENKSSSTGSSSGQMQDGDDQSSAGDSGGSNDLGYGPRIYNSVDIYPTDIAAGYRGGTPTDSGAITPLATFVSTSLQAAATYSEPPRRNAGTGRFQRPTASSGLGGIGLMYLIWPFIMGVVLAL